jgi:hypothetical protein
MFRNKIAPFKPKQRKMGIAKMSINGNCRFIAVA